MAFGFEKPTIGGAADRKAGRPAEADPGRRKFLRDAGIVLAGTAVGAGALHELLVDGKKEQEVVEGRVKAQEEPESVESENVHENPMDEMFSYEKGVKEIGMEEFEKMVDYWVWQYTEGDFAGDFDSAIDGLRQNWSTVSHEFDKESVPRTFALVSMYESFWNNETWGKGGPFQLTPWAAGRFNVNPKTIGGSAKGAAKLFAEIIKEVSEYSESDDVEKFGVLRYNATFFRKYLISIEKGGSGAAPTMAGFLAYMSGRAEEIRKEICVAHGNSKWGQQLGKKMFDGDIKNGAFGIKINIEYAAKYEATKRIFEAKSSLARMLRPDNKTEIA